MFFFYIFTLTGATPSAFCLYEAFRQSIYFRNDGLINTIIPCFSLHLIKQKYFHINIFTLTGATPSAFCLYEAFRQSIYFRNDGLINTIIPCFSLHLIKQKYYQVFFTLMVGSFSQVWATCFHINGNFFTLMTQKFSHKCFFHIFTLTGATLVQS